jgi:hypothetical protein
MQNGLKPALTNIHRYESGSVHDPYGDGLKKSTLIQEQPVIRGAHTYDGRDGRYVPYGGIGGSQQHSPTYSLPQNKVTQVYRAYGQN